MTAPIAISALPMQAFVGLGGNVGDVVSTLHAAIHALSGEQAVSALRSSRLYLSQAWGPVAQDHFTNQVVEFSWSAAPEALLEFLLSLEVRFGRQREIAQGPRTLDLDLLAVGGLQRSSDALTLPHPRLALRRFVLVPFAELAPDFVIQGLGATVTTLLESCTDTSWVRPLSGSV
ncbi:MAG: 2-amino-4-hydroxy-6-hydroxymethyldihydropteridine diphosphokinase [Myxococcales bacterium]|nr:2-amino-4-hydroxy-6-hydroxymethyldihydropteridine diphosphokinase [Myxococcales bacterium]